MKLSDFTIEELKKWLRAIDKLRNYYSKFRPNQIPESYGNHYVHEWCPLCVVAGEDKCGIWECHKCLWPILEGDYCSYKSYDRQKAMTRRKRLDRWNKLIKEEIKRREG